ncbi:sensor histidine kinase [Lolliginicoccus levis]|uniref:sensor histidine kinase n=1 Tax=Lolliginicoccus levis TaxID=2919542 RepID=UPI00241D8F3E|nr:sensor histidine kinase [Lolliginicoccus levis]
MIRLVAVMAGIAGVLFILVAASAIQEQAAVASADWSVLAAVVLAGGALLPVVAGALAPLRAVRMAGAAYALLYALVVLSGFVAYPRGGLDWGDWPWTSAVCGAVASVVAAVCSRRLAWLHLGAMMCLVVGQMSWATGRLWARLLSEEVSGSLALVVILVVAVSALRSGAALVDRETAAIWAESARVAAARASSEERARVDALVHDTVLSALALAGQGHAEEEAVKAADHGLRAIHGLRLREEDLASAIAPGVAAELIVPSHAVASGFANDVVATGDLPIPALVVHAVQAAVGEAVVNSLRHAGTGPVARRISGHVAPGRITVSIVDDGAGFDPRTVPPRRIGIALSIKERMRTLPGGIAEVQSAPGQGTTVRIGWKAL